MKHAEKIKKNLQALAIQQGILPQVLYDRYFRERFLARLAASPHKDLFILKGGALLHVLDGVNSRETRDVDMLATFIANTQETVETIIREILGMSDYERDGVTYDLDDMRIKEIREETDYGGFRVVCRCYLGEMKFKLTIDIAFGDRSDPEFVEREYPIILKGTFSDFSLKTYSKASIISEKIQAAMSLGERNGRMKDFYDIYQLLEAYPTEPSREDLKNAIRLTFRIRQFSVDPGSVVFLLSFTENEDILKRWVDDFLGKNPTLPQLDFPTVMARIREVIQPIMQELYDEQSG